jgi:hypothetical protein
MIFINAIEIDECLASHLVGPNPFLCDQLISFSFPEFAIATPVLKFDQPTLLIVVVVNHGSQSRFDNLSHKDQDWAAKAGIARHDRQPLCEMTLLSSLCAVST